MCKSKKQYQQQSNSVLDFIDRCLKDAAPEDSSSFTHALSCGENPLWIAKVMGHRDTDMIIRVYGKYIENAGKHEDGAKFDGIYKGVMSKEK